MATKMATRTASRTVIAAMINASEGTFIGATYERKDGSMTTINGRIGCHRDTLCKLPSAQANRFCELVTIYDVKRKGYRSISLDRLDRITMRGVTYQVH